MIDVVVVVMVVVVVALVVIGRRTQAARKRSGRSDVLATLAPVIGGAVSRDQVLTGRYHDHDVQVTLRSADPAPPDLPGGVSSEAYLVEVVRLRLLGVRGAQPWWAWRSVGLTGTTWRFGRTGTVPGIDRLARMAGMPEADTDLPDRLRSAGMLDLFERLGPPTHDSFPHVRFVPELRSRMAERLGAAGVEPPRSAQPPTAEAGPWLEVEVERADAADPAPDRFRVILDTAVRIAELNALANPADRTAT